VRGCMTFSYMFSTAWANKNVRERVGLLTFPPCFIFNTTRARDPSPPPPIPTVVTFPLISCLLSCDSVSPYVCVSVYSVPHIICLRMLQ
jgi:hypothetical protein